MNRSTRNSIVALALIGGALTCCFGSCVVLGAFGAHEQAAWDPISPACNGVGVASAPAYARTPGIHRAAAFERSTASWIHHGYGTLPEDLRATEPAQAELVVCLEPDATSELVEHCEYLMDGSGVRVGASTTRAIDRYRQVRTLSIREARTGTALTTSRVYGPMPALCPDEYEFGGTTTDRIDGSEPGPDELRPLVEAFAVIR